MDHECLNCGNKLGFTSEDSLYRGCPECGCRLFSYSKRAPGDLMAETGGGAEETGRVEGPRNRKIVEKVETVLLELEEREGDIAPEDLESIRVRGDGVFEISLEKLTEGKPLIIELEEGEYRIHLSSLFGESKKRIDLEDLDI